MRILQVNISDIKGGACVISWNLHEAYKKLHYSSSIAVKNKFSDDNDVVVIENDDARGPWYRVFNALAASIDKKDFYLSHKVAALTRFLSTPGQFIRKYLGVEEFNFPASRALRIADVDIIHCHILHGGYFDLRNLQEWSKIKPVIVTLHDAWLLSGHCAHSFDCDRWLTGCATCPDISIPVPIERDNAAYNWKRKKEIYSQSNLYVATPCHWLMNKVERSILRAGVRKSRVIGHGVNRQIFKRGDKKAARTALGIDQKALVLLFSANGIRRSRWKDFEMMRNAVEIIGHHPGEQKVIFLALGEDAPREIFRNAEIRFVPFRTNPQEVAMFYMASDIYLHGSKVDTFPNAVLEALSCGIPVVATAVGGIPEQVNGLKSFGHPEINSFSSEKATGILTPAGDASAFANAIEYLASDVALRKLLSGNAVADAEVRFNLTLQINNYLEWYQEILEDFQSLKA